MDTNKTVNEKWIYLIKAGPSKDAIFDSCKSACDKEASTVTFEIELSYKEPQNPFGSANVPLLITDAIITSVSHEDGSGESFHLLGRCTVDLSYYDETAEPTKYRFSAYYNSNTGEGIISFIT